MITNKQKEFFNRLKEQYGKQPLPSFEIIANDFGFKHKNSIWQYFNKLKEACLINEYNNKFYIAPEQFGAILYSNPVKAGFASPAEDYIEKRVSLDDDFKLNNPSIFMFTVSGDSMVDVGIYEDDKVIVRKTTTAKNGDIVLASVDGEYTLKTYRQKGKDVYLEPANKKYSIIKPENELIIFGIVTGVIRYLE